MPSRPRNSADGPAAAPEPGRAGPSMLSGLLSLTAAWWPRTRSPRRPPPSPKPSAPREAGAASMLSGLLSVTAAAGRFRPWPRPGRPARGRPRRGEVKAAILVLLTHVDHHEDRATRRPVAADTPGARSVGLSYREILKQIRTQYPGGRSSIMTIRSYARDARQQGMAMPYRRPYSSRRRNPGH